MSARIEVLSKPGCHLCDEAEDVVARVAGDAGVEWQSHDISGDEELMAKWGELVPVVLVDGDVHAWFRVDAARLRSALAS